MMSYIDRQDGKTSVGALITKLCCSFCCLVTLAAVPGIAYGQIVLPGAGLISTVAGSGTAGSGGDGGLATSTSAELNHPYGLAVDSAGNIYIADYLNSRIRKVTASTGVITTVAGSTGGFSDGPVASAQLNGPASVALDSAGNIYIADYGNNRLRVVNTTGASITIAGVPIPAGYVGTVAGNGQQVEYGDNGPASSAKLDGPSGVAVDAAGNIYIADAGGARIRAINAKSTHTVTIAMIQIPVDYIDAIAGGSTVCTSPPHDAFGNGCPATQAELSQPAGVALDSSGNIYISDISHYEIRKVTASTGTISQFAGTGTAGYSGDGGPAISAELSSNPYRVAVDNAGNIYIADSASPRIRMVAASTGYISTIAGNGTACGSPTASCGDGMSATSAELNFPVGVAVDNYRNIYIGDSFDNRVRAVGASAQHVVLPAHLDIDRIAGNGNPGSAGDGGPATGAELNNPFGVAVDGSGNIYVADCNNNLIRKVNASTGIISTVAGNGTAGYSGDGGAATSAELNRPTGVAVDTVGNIYVADFQNNRIRKVTVSTGKISTVAGTGAAGYSGDGGAATSAKLYLPQGVALDAAGNIYIADNYNFRIRKVAVSTGKISTVAGNGTGGESGDGGSATSAELAYPDAVALDAAGNIYIAEETGERIRKVTASTGKISTVAGNGTFGYAGDGGQATSAELFTPEGVALDSSGNIYIADEVNQRVRKVTVSTGIITTVAGNGTSGYSGDGGAAINAELDDPLGVALDAAGYIYISESTDHIRVVGQ
jgi:sugar lactone lactonase YvrE